MDIFNIIYFVIGGLSFWIFYEFGILRKNKNAYNFFNLLKKRVPLVFLETDKAVYYKPIVKMYKNLGVTSDKEIVIIPKSSIKPCLNLNGILIGHGDLYKSITTPQEFRMLVNQLQLDGWKDEDIAKFFEEIESLPKPQLESMYKNWKMGKSNNPENPEDISPIDMKKYDVYINLPSVVKDFIYTGLNRISIHAMLRELVFQRELEKIGQRNWLMIAIAILLILIGIGIAWRFIVGTPGFMEGISRLTGSAQIKPTP